MHGANVLTRKAPPRKPEEKLFVMHPCTSSLLAAYGYSPELLEMRAQFKDGKTFRYRGVTPERFQKFIEAESKGSHFMREIARKYEKEAVV